MVYETRLNTKLDFVHTCLYNKCSNVGGTLAARPCQVCDSDGVPAFRLLFASTTAGDEISGLALR